jgi:NAD(P)-dependent dehydrogenase (short-subunit alcohol dehydrogenase family)
VLATLGNIEAGFAPVDILVNNVGMPGTPNKHVPFAESHPEDWRPWIDINIYGSLHCLRAVLPGMCARGWGRVIQISSAMASRGLPNRESLLGGSKAGIEGTLRSVALEVADRGVTINTLALGLLENAVTHARDDIVEATLARVPIRRFLSPDEVGAAVAYLASEEAAFVTGQVHHLNGGAYQGR